MLFFKKIKYLSWAEYSEKICQREYLDFVTKSIEDSANNFWAKEDRKW